MRIAALEHFTALEGSRGDPRAAEGRCMRDAVVADLRRLPGVEVRVIGRHGDLRAALGWAEAVLIVAPEEDRILEGLVRRVERSGGLHLGPSSRAVRLLADKHRTGAVLAAAGVPTPATRLVRLSRASRDLRGLRPPFVLKPRDGCGGAGVVRVARAADLRGALGEVRRSTGRDDCLAQELVPGTPASVSLIVADRIVDLGLNRQRLRRGRGFAYLGGETFWPHPLAAEARRAARAAAKALAASCPGVRGYLGVDLVIGPDGVRVIEVNPRLTTSYVGLRRSIRENLAGLILDAALGRPLPDRITRRGRCRFTARGITTILPDVARPRGARRREWPAASAGTSAASI